MRAGNSRGRGSRSVRRRESRSDCWPARAPPPRVAVLRPKAGSASGTMVRATTFLAETQRPLRKFLGAALVVEYVQRLVILDGKLLAAALDEKQEMLVGRNLLRF